MTRRTKKRKSKSKRKMSRPSRRNASLLRYRGRTEAKQKLPPDERYRSSNTLDKEVKGFISKLNKFKEKKQNAVC